MIAEIFVLGKACTQAGIPKAVFPLRAQRRPTQKDMQPSWAQRLLPCRCVPGEGPRPQRVLTPRRCRAVRAELAVSWPKPILR